MKNKITMKIGNMFRITNMKTEDYKNLIFFALGNATELLPEIQDLEP